MKSAPALGADLPARAVAKSVAIVQSNYIPWRGYFDLINSVDEFILYDDVQYTRRDWRNRNVVKSAGGIIWLTIPVEVKGKYFEKIKHIRVPDSKWARDHWRTIIHSYSQYHEYRQLYPPFVPKISIIDLIFNEGVDATKYMKSFYRSL